MAKAREVYLALSVDDSGQYEIVKNAILKAYELGLEACRQKFRNTVKLAIQTRVEFARHKVNLFDRWCMLNTIKNNFEKLRQLILVEECKNCAPSDVRIYLDERKADTLSQAAILADHYVLTHKNSFNHRPAGPSQKSDSHVRPNNYNFKGTLRNGPQSSRSGNKMASFLTGLAYIVFINCKCFSPGTCLPELLVVKIVTCTSAIISDNE